MSSQMTLKVANVTATVTVGANITDAAVAAALTRYARSLAIPITGVAQDDLAAILAHVVDDIRRRAKAVDVADQQAAAQASQQSTADSNNNL